MSTRITHVSHVVSASSVRHTPTSEPDYLSMCGTYLGTWLVATANDPISNYMPRTEAALEGVSCEGCKAAMRQVWARFA